MDYITLCLEIPLTYLERNIYCMILIHYRGSRYARLACKRSIFTMWGLVGTGSWTKRLGFGRSMKFDNGFCFIFFNACCQRQFICRRPVSRQFNCPAHLLITAEILRQVGKLLSALIKAFSQTASLFLNITGAIAPVAPVLNTPLSAGLICVAKV